MTDAATVTVIGSGVAATDPDEVTIAVGVNGVAATPAEAMADTAAALAALRAALLGNGANERRMQTSGVSLHPDWDHSHEGRRLVGYVASVGLTVTLAADAQVGQLLDAALRAAGEAARIGGLRWDVADRAAAEESARAAAFADARSRAEHYAQMSGRSLGAVVRIDERSDFGMPRRPAARFLAASASLEMDADAGEVEITSSVTVTWELA